MPQREFDVDRFAAEAKNAFSSPIRVGRRPAAVIGALSATAIVRAESSHVRGERAAIIRNDGETALRFLAFSRLSLVYGIRG
jgi:hypothetical protein